MARCFRTIVSAFAGALLVALPALAGELVNKDGDDIAIKGYDTVAYFTEGRPVPGKAEFEHEWQGARWRFSSAEHRELFASAPDKYAPRYGGFCAGGMAAGWKVPIDPEAWVIVDGKLYLNFSKNGRDEFAEEPAPQIAKADDHWERLSKVEWSHDPGEHLPICWWYALSSIQAGKVLNARLPRFFDLMWSLLGQRRGSRCFGKVANLLDQFLADPSLSAAAGRPKGRANRGFLEMVGRATIRSAPVRVADREGFSDYYPVSVILDEE